jgi:hypothetical protein
MDRISKDKINVRETVEKAISNHPEFHFFVDELTPDDYMPTYAGVADEKYTYDRMDEEFFRFIERKIDSDGLYLRICYLTGECIDGEAVFTIEIAGEKKVFRTNDLDSVQVVEMADYGIKIKGDEVTFGTTVEGGCGQTPYFAEFGSKRGNETYLSKDNPLNKYIMVLMKDFLKV